MVLEHGVEVIRLVNHGNEWGVFRDSFEGGYWVWISVPYEICGSDMKFFAVDRRGGVLID